MNLETILLGAERAEYEYLVADIFIGYIRMSPGLTGQRRDAP